MKRLFSAITILAMSAALNYSATAQEDEPEASPETAQCIDNFIMVAEKELAPGTVGDYFVIASTCGEPQTESADVVVPPDRICIYQINMDAERMYELLLPYIPENPLPNVYACDATGMAFVVKDRLLEGMILYSKPDGENLQIITYGVDSITPEGTIVLGAPVEIYRQTGENTFAARDGSLYQLDDKDLPQPIPE